jgi:hypothetical protein
MTGALPVGCELHKYILQTGFSGVHGEQQQTAASEGKVDLPGNVGPFIRFYNRLSAPSPSCVTRRVLIPGMSDRILRSSSSAPFAFSSSHFPAAMRFSSFPVYLLPRICPWRK